MKINQIQSQLAYNRQQLSNMHQEQKIFFGAASAHKNRNQLRDYWYYRNLAIKLRKPIATLAALQKALKKDLARELSYGRAARQMGLMKASAIANVGEVF